MEEFAGGDATVAAPQPLGGSGGRTTVVADRGVSWLVGEHGERFRLSSVTTVGRADGNDLCIASQIVSRYHAILRDVNDRWILIDLDSLNGTRVNGESIYAPRVLHQNDQVQFGDTAFVFKTRLAGGGEETPDVDFTIAAFATTHCRLLFQPGSFAQKQCQVAGDRLERYYAIATERFGLAGITGPIGIYLLNQVTDPNGPGSMLDSGGYADPEQALIYAVYRPESPGIVLERHLLTLLQRAMAPDAAWPDALAEGVHRFVLGQSKAESSGDDEAAPLVAMLERDALPSLHVLLASGDESVEVAPLAISNFLSYVASKYGESVVGPFCNQVVTLGPDAAARAATGNSLAKLDKAWRRHLRRAEINGFRRFVKLLLPYLRPYRLRIAEIMIYVVLSAAFGIVLAKANGYLIDRALVPRDEHAFVVIVVVVVSSFIAVTLSSLRETYAKAWVSERVLKDMRLAMFSKIQALHPGYFDQVSTGDLLTRINSDLSMVGAALTNGLVESARLTLTMLLATIAIFLMDWKLSFVVVVGLPLILLIARSLGRPVARASLERQREASGVTNIAQENLGAQPVVKLFGLERLMTERFARQLDRLVRSSIRLSFVGGLYGVVSSSAATLIELTVLSAGGYLVLHGHLSVGTLFAFILLIGQVVAPLQGLSGLLQFVQQATGSMKRVQEVIGARPAIQDTPEARPLGRLSREIQLEHVSFGYDESRRVLTDINLSIPAGSSVAIVGASGSGKSTVLSLLTRFYDPDLGHVCFDGLDLRQATLESLRGQIGMVFQESVLFDDTIRENIRLGRPGATDQDVENAARAAEIHDFIMQLPDGYETPVGARGGHLSGGQRQRVAIARALVRNPALLLLDEATSALDPATEAAINATLRRVAAGRTTISVTHRLGSVVQLDQIYVLAGGRLVEQGTHEELLKHRGTYARLWEEQLGGLITIASPESQQENAALRSVPLFAGLDKTTLDSLAANLQIEHFERDADLMRQGEAGDHLYVIREGDVDVLVDDGGAERRLAQLHAGDYVGEIALLRDVPRTATVRARTSVEAYSLSRESFQSMLAVFPMMREEVNQTLEQREAALGGLRQRRDQPAVVDGVAPG
jgi:ATP-binding cassette subfamily B protein